MLSINKRVRARLGIFSIKIGYKKKLLCTHKNERAYFQLRYEITLHTQEWKWFVWLIRATVPLYGNPCTHATIFPATIKYKYPLFKANRVSRHGFTLAQAHPHNALSCVNTITSPIHILTNRWMKQLWCIEAIKLSNFDTGYSIQPPSYWGQLLCYA